MRRDSGTRYRRGPIRILILLVGLAIVFSAPPAHGQPVTGYGIKLGPSFGRQVYTSELVGDIDFMENSLTGFDLGLFLKLSGRGYFFQGELHFVQKGSVDEQARTDGAGNVIGTIRTRFRVDYLSLPISAGLEVWSRESSLYVFAGPRIDIWTGSASEWFERDFKNSKRALFGGDLGAGVRVPFGESLAILVEMRYAHDLTNILKADMYSLRNRTFLILLGIERSAAHGLPVPRTP
ncbi:outer membrane beta-barrel protein [Gemmatimonadota bacterium]